MKRLFCLLLLSGCTMDGGTPKPGQVLACTDFRDHEQFVIRSEHITNVRQGIGTPSCFDAIDDTGKKHAMCSDLQQFIKCEAAK